MTRDIGLGPAQLLVILAMSLVLVIVMRWVVSLARKWYGNLNTSLNEGLMREMIEVDSLVLNSDLRFPLSNKGVKITLHFLRAGRSLLSVPLVISVDTPETVWANGNYFK